METYHWQRNHVLNPPVTVSITRSLPEGDWTVRCEGLQFPPQFGTSYPTFDQAMKSADGIVLSQQPHDCGRLGCTDWSPVPPEPDDHLS